MHAATDRLEFTPPPTPGLLRAMGLALLAHAFLLAALTWGVHWKSEAVTVTAEAELWSATVQQAAPPLVERPPEPSAPAPESAPVAPAPTQIEPLPSNADIALAQEKLRLQKAQQKAMEKEKVLEKQRLEKLKQEKLLLEKQRLQEKRDQDRKTAEDKKKSEQDAKHREALKTQEEAKKISALRDDNLKRMAGLAGATGAPGASGTATQSSGPSASYQGRIRARIKPNIVFVDDIAGNPLAEVDVRTAPDGTIISRKLLKSSGVKSWDDAVLKAIDKTEKLPPDVDGRMHNPYTIVFNPKD